MKLIIYIVVLLSAVIIGGYRIERQNNALKKIEQKVKDLDNGYAIGTAVYATRDIKEGELVEANALETRALPINKMPDHIICHAADVIGRRPHYGIEKGQLLSMFDFQTASEVYGDIKKTRASEQ